ncbi:MAG: 3-deoxy-D-manno-octulosonic acid transferase [Bacteroidetes bacterium]|nr:3-deoxy-D-manno-octulosonic acid transferase [Bacteroidota bacterium]
MFIYNLVVLLYGLIIRLASFKKTKAKQWIQGRRDWKKIYAQKIAALNSQDITWVHCASYGEFEQGRPLIEKIKKDYPNSKVVLTFFSPSGYEEVKNWPGADVIGYLPLDTKSNAEEFIRIVKPKAAIFIKYEFWLNFLFCLQRHNIKTYLVSAVFKPHHPFFKWYGFIFRKSLATFEKLYIQDQQSALLLESIGVKNYEVSGDTRFDRVIEIRERFESIPSVQQFCGDSQIIVAGSTWKEDEELLIHVIEKIKSPDVKLIIAPHEINPGSIERLVKLLKENGISFSLYSSNTPFKNEKILILDTFGLLSKLYHYCDLAYIGGGFSEGIHNCLEAAVYLKPVIFYGTTHHKYNEALELISLEAAKNVNSIEEAVDAANYFLDNKGEEKLKSTLQKYFDEKSGTTKKVLASLKFS